MRDVNNIVAPLITVFEKRAKEDFNRPPYEAEQICSEAYFKSLAHSRVRCAPSKLRGAAHG